jgi:hypothetical protein
MRPHLLGGSVSVPYPNASGPPLAKRFSHFNSSYFAGFPLASLKFSIHNERFHQLLTKQDH